MDDIATVSSPNGRVGRQLSYQPLAAIATVAVSLNSRPDLLTPGEARLLDLIPTKYANYPWPTVVDCTRMPPSSKRKLIRPSSASAKLQTHPSFETGLFDNRNAGGFSSYVSVNPISIEAAEPSGRPLLPHRPKTHVGGGAKSWSRTQASVARHTRLEDVDQSSLRRGRRLTLTGTEGVTDEDLAFRRRQLSQLSRNGRIKGKVDFTRQSSVIGTCFIL